MAVLYSKMSQNDNCSHVFMLDFLQTTYTRQTCKDAELNLQYITQWLIKLGLLNLKTTLFCLRNTKL